MPVRRFTAFHAVLRAWPASGHVARLAPLLGAVASLVITGVTAAASGGGDFPIWRR